MAFITVSDAAGRVLFRRRATDGEIAEAVRVAEDADAGAESAMHEIAAQRYAALASGTTIEQQLEPPTELQELEAYEDLERLADESQGEEAPVMAEAESGEAGLFDDAGLQDDSWFGEARFTDEEELVS